RAGVVTASIGFALALAAFLLSLNENDFLPVILPGFVTFMVGIGIIINGLLFTLPRKELPGTSYEALAQQVLDSGQNRVRYEAPVPANLTNELGPGAPSQLASVTEHTTHHL